MSTALRAWKDKSVGQASKLDWTTVEVLKVLHQLFAVPFHSPISVSGGHPLTAYYSVDDRYV